MDKYRYKAMNDDGKYVRGRLSAEGQGDLRALLENQGLFYFQIIFGAVRAQRFVKDSFSSPIPENLEPFKKDLKSMHNLE